MTDDGKQMLLIGEDADTRKVTDSIPGNLIYKVFPRPLSNDCFVAEVIELFGKIASGELKYGY